MKRKIVTFLMTVIMMLNVVHPAVLVYAMEEQLDIKELSKVDYNVLVRYACINTDNGAAITVDDDLYIWGINGYGQLCNDSKTPSLIPIKVFENVKSVSSYSGTFAAITNDGSLYTWGHNWNAALGDGTEEDSCYPIKILDKVNDVFFAGGYTMAVTQDESLYIWGYDSAGLFGEAKKMYLEPVKVMDGVKFACGCSNLVAIIKEDNGLYVFGKTNTGILGRGIDVDESTIPVKVLDDVIDVSFSGETIAAITRDNSLYLWGWNGRCQIGNGTNIDSYIPVKVMDNVIDVSIGVHGSAAVTTDGNLYVWGQQYSSSVTTNILSTPTLLMTNVKSIYLTPTVVGTANYAAVTLSGELYTWGFGLLGNGTSERSEKPIEIEIKKSLTDEEIKRLETEDFVNRLYSLVLKRESDAVGIESWTNALLNGESSGVDVGYGFVFSTECIERNLSNDEYVEMLYNTFMDRSSDETGKQAWILQLEAGVDREKILEGFIYSDEFVEICNTYGITIGNTSDVDSFASVVNFYRNQNADITKFVARCYQKVLERDFEIDGLEAWCKAIITKENTPKEVVQSFIFSDEFIGKKLNNEEYVKVLYATFMDREADELGLNGWVSVLENGEDNRTGVLEGFADSDEFAWILYTYGLEQDKYAVPYCEVNLIDIKNALKNILSKGLIYNPNDMAQNEVVDCEVEFGDVSVINSNEVGFKEMTITFTTLLYTDIRNNLVRFYTPGFSLYDYYTGELLNGEDSVLDGDISENLKFEKNIEFNGMNYNISGEIEIENTYPSVIMSGGTMKQECLSNWTMKVKVPENYDGLILGVLPTTVLEDNKEGTHILDDYVEGTYFFRIIP